MIAAVVLLAAIGVERVCELVVSARNARWSLAHGGDEYARGQVLPMIVLHVGLIVGSVLEWWLAGSFVPWLGWPMLVLVVLANALRWWSIRSLGRQWCIRVIVVPGLTAVARGPYRRMPHPNYLAVAVEGAALPLVFTGWITALAFTIFNAVLLLGFRIPAENRALARLQPADIAPAPAPSARTDPAVPVSPAVRVSPRHHGPALNDGNDPKGA